MLSTWRITIRYEYELQLRSVPIHGMPFSCRTVVRCSFRSETSEDDAQFESVKDSAEVRFEGIVDL